MRILVVSQFFWPEDFLLNDFVAGLRDSGNEVEVLTGLPNYPQGRFFDGYGLTGPYRDSFGGVRVVRCPVAPRGNGSALRLFANYASFVLSATAFGPMSAWRRFDLLLFWESSPITAGIPARVMKAVTRAKMAIWVQDLWPESLSATGFVRSPYVLEVVRWITRWVYRGCDLVLVQSRAFRESVRRHGGRRLMYFPNWAESLFTCAAVAGDSERNEVPGGFVIMFAGNVGTAQDFETILAAAEMTQGHGGINWVVLGDGSRLRWAAEQVSARGIRNLHLLGRRPRESMPRYFSLADVMLVSLKDEEIFALTVPAKVQAYLACGKPVLASLNGEGARIIEEAGAGLAVPAASPEKLAKAALSLSALPRPDLERMGSNARKYYEKNFSRDLQIRKFIRTAERMIKTNARPGRNVSPG